jgi:mono/diheme cytochrome c family protein
MRRGWIGAAGVAAVAAGVAAAAAAAAVVAAAVGGPAGRTAGGPGPVGMERRGPAHAAVPAVQLDTAAARELFRGRGNCATCHGPEGRGTLLAPDLTAGGWLHADSTLGSVVRVIREGIARPAKFPAPMPPMGGARLRDAEIEALARYVLALRAAAGG